MNREREYTLAEIAVELGVSIDLVMSARSMLGLWPTRRDAAGMAFYDQPALSRIHRLVIERDGSVLFEHDPKAFKRFLNSHSLTLTEPTAEDIAFAELVQSDVAAAERLLDELYPTDAEDCK